MICTSPNQTCVLQNIYYVWTCEGGVLAQVSGEFHSFDCMLYHYFCENRIAFGGCSLSCSSPVLTKCSPIFQFQFSVLLFPSLLLDHTKSNAARGQKNIETIVTFLVLPLLFCSNFSPDNFCYLRDILIAIVGI